MRRIGWLMLGIVLPCTSVAEPEMPERLRDLPHAGMQCMRDSGERAALPDHDAAPDFSCAIDVPEVRRKGAGAMLIDVRLPADFAAYQIAGSLNLTASELKTRSYLQHKELILVGNGRQDTALYVSCGMLRRAGFGKVAVLRGGVLGWARSGGAIQGKAPALRDQARLAPAELYQASRHVENAMLLMPDRQSFRQWLPQLVTLPASDPAALARLLKQRRRELPEHPLAAVVLVGFDPGEDEWRAMQAVASPAPLLFYPGSADDYAAYSRLQQAQWQARDNGPRQPRCGG
ncbi:rhodanese-like domain-containing protein [Chitiniphilus shinanonensis]|uniref:rhodanese-like domain-containing protein n=1 Tax=Chitiniphilus shinanonensis TaxID=553088 RepID=UPI00306B594B